MSFKRSKVNQYTGTTLLTIDGVNTKEEADWYLGKRVAYIYKAKTKKAGPNGPTKFRCVWGKVTRPHGTSGAVRAKFHKNLSPKSLGGEGAGHALPQQHLKLPGGPGGVRRDARG